MILTSIGNKIFGSRNDRLLKKYSKVVSKINELEPKYEKFTDEELQNQTIEFKNRLQNGETLDDILCEAFAVVREASKRTIEQRHFDVQLIGGMVLHDGNIAEMKTGEGKTLAATLPAYLNALTGKGVHVITVNDYLASRDADQMGKIYGYLGLTTGKILSEMSTEDRQKSYACDITYGTNNEFGFDYLRDNMAFEEKEQVQRELNFGIVDEVDSILIDEARTPLIISGPSEDSSELYIKLNQIIPKLKKREKEDGEGDYYLDEKVKQAYLTEDGHSTLEKLLVKAKIISEGDSLYSPQNLHVMHYATALLRAHTLFHIDVDYMIKDGEILIVDEHTGRAMPGRRWSDGLHQAVEAKEGVKIQGENQTMASITFQNYFRIYKKLSGMTGTADTEAYEFQQIYDLEVVMIPTNEPMIRKDNPDAVYLTQKEKFEAIVNEIKSCIKRKQPVLVGTASIEVSEYIAHLLTKAKIKHQVLNAKQHAREALVIADAGRPRAVTIATNMAGRGTDIILGGNWQLEIDELKEPTAKDIEKIKTSWQKRHNEVIKAGGLHILGSERHESRRIDNQLRGRSGRQGDPGSSRFFLSLEDNLIRIFAPDWMEGMMRRAGMGNGQALESRMVSKTIENAQKKVESHNFDIRKHLLEYDDVANDQRHVIYTQRQELLGTEDVSEITHNMLQDVATNITQTYIPPQSLEEQWDIEGLENALEADFLIKIPIKAWIEDKESVEEEEIRNYILEKVFEQYKDKRDQTDNKLFNQYEKAVLLQTMDNHWREHLANMDHLRNSIGLRGYAQQDPKQAYKKECFELFSDMLDTFKYNVISTISKVQIKAPEEVNAVENQWRHSTTNMNFNHQELDGMGNSQESDESNANPYVREGKKVGRNEPCPCGSGKKYKQCHGKIS